MRRAYHCGMQALRDATIATADGCARELLASVPGLMRVIRAEMRGHRQAPLTVPQFRTLVFVNYHAAASLSVLAEHLGLSLPATSRMIDVLAKRGLLARRAQPSDRRCLALSLTHRGRVAFRAAHDATRAALARRLAELSAAELAAINQALAILNRVLPSACGQPRVGPSRRARRDACGVLA